jgi:hypothetical protein
VQGCACLIGAAVKYPATPHSTTQRGRFSHFSSGTITLPRLVTRCSRYSRRSGCMRRSPNPQPRRIVTTIAT